MLRLLLDAVLCKLNSHETLENGNKANVRYCERALAILVELKYNDFLGPDEAEYSSLCQMGLKPRAKCII